MPKSRIYMLLSYILIFGSTIGFYEQGRLIYIFIGLIGGILCVFKTLNLTKDKKKRKNYLLLDFIVIIGIQIVSYCIPNFDKYGGTIIIIVVFPYMYYMIKKTY